MSAARTAVDPASSAAKAFPSLARATAANAMAHGAERQGGGHTESTEKGNRNGTNASQVDLQTGLAKGSPAEIERCTGSSATRQLMTVRRGMHKKKEGRVSWNSQRTTGREIEG